MKKIIKPLGIAALLLSSMAANAATLTVDYHLNNMPSLTGSFTGTDSNADGFLKFNELTSFSFSYDNNINLSSLNGLGDFDIANNSWLHNAVSWVGYGNIAWFTWNNRFFSANTMNVTGMTTSFTSQPSEVPVPAAVWLFGSGLAGLLGARKKKTA